MSSSDESSGPRCGINNKSMNCLQNVSKPKQKKTGDRTSDLRVSEAELAEERQQRSDNSLSANNDCRDLVERESNGLEHESPRTQKHCKTKKKGLFKTLKASKQSHSSTESNVTLPYSQSLEAVTSGMRSTTKRAQGQNLKEVIGNTRRDTNKKVVYGVSRRVDSLYSPKSKSKNMSTAENIKKQKENSFAFSFTQVINSTPSTSSSPNANEMDTSDQSLDFSKLPSDDGEKNSEEVEKAVYSKELSLPFETEHEERKPAVRIHATEISCKEEDPGIPLSVTTSTENVNLEEDVPDTTFASSICGYALSFVDAVGNVMLTFIDKVNKTNMDNKRSVYTELNLNASQSLDTVDAQLINEYERLNRMNSWETFGTVGTTGTTTTTATQKSVDTSNSRSSSRSRKIKRTKRKKTVGFEYPPISSMKECPRITNEERKLLFFTEEELEEAERDRKSNISDDVEVVAIQKSMTEESQSVKSCIDHNDSFTAGSKSFGKNRTIMPENKLTPSLKVGKYSKAAEQVNAVDTKSSRSSSSQGSSDKSPSSQSSKIKGVQIYLRQRSVR